jgi:hypothetical protein
VFAWFNRYSYSRVRRFRNHTAIDGLRRCLQNLVRHIKLKLTFYFTTISANGTDCCLTAIDTLPSRTLRRTIRPGTLPPCTPIDTPRCNVSAHSIITWRRDPGLKMCILYVLDDGGCKKFLDNCSTCERLNGSCLKSFLFWGVKLNNNFGEDEQRDPRTA